MRPKQKFKTILSRGRKSVSGQTSTLLRETLSVQSGKWSLA
jgi:hypothetical protein